MAAALHCSPIIMPIDTLFSLSSSPPVSYYMNNAASTYLYHQRGLQPQDSSHFSSSPPSFTSMTGLSLPDSSLFTTTPVTPYNTNNSSQRSISNLTQKDTTHIHPLRSCLRMTETTQPCLCNGDASDCSKTMAPNTDSSNNTDLAEQMDRIRITERLSPGISPKKHVKFADDRGLALVTIKYLESSTDEDFSPVLSQELLRHITQDAKPEPCHPYNYIADFEQPASSYLEFRERLEKEFVSLENVMVRDNIRVRGTVKVKNIAFEKTVNLRVTFDEWRTCNDVPAVFVPQENISASRYDTFAFEFDIPPNQGGKTLQFCINYQTPDGSFWDNNQGNNYHMVSQAQRSTNSNRHNMSSYYASVDDHKSWGNFSFWKVAEKDETPYW